jgi:BirA family transcriptional regulator, biotin operon repressor / biotin---[acetyl-CoA-carboxylase] ligase
MIGKNLIELEETRSTNRYAFERIKNCDITEGTVISAIHQSSGRGLGENKWKSEARKNITASIIVKPVFLPLQRQFMLNIFTSLAVRDMLSRFIPEKETIKIKWPNDIYIKNKKASGILIENIISGNAFQCSVIGIGININQENFISDAPNPVSLNNITGTYYDLKECLGILCSCLDERYFQLKEGGYEILEEEYLDVLYKKGELASFVYQDQMIEATIMGISEEGKLILETLTKEILACNFKEIEFIN